MDNTTSLDQANMVKWGSSLVAGAAGGYVGYKVAAKYAKSKPVFALIGAVVLGGGVFAAIHYGTKTTITNTSSSQAPAQNTDTATQRTATKLSEEGLTVADCTGRGGSVKYYNNGATWRCIGGLNSNT